jgi:hypothetical protein
VAYAERPGTLAGAASEVTNSSNARLWDCNAGTTFNEPATISQHPKMHD